MLDRELKDLATDLRLRERMRLTDGLLVSSTSPVPREHIDQVIGEGGRSSL